MELTGHVSMNISVAAVNEMISVVDANAVGGVEDHVDPNGVVPPDLVRFLARLRLLEGVPFNYLVPDATLLPLETIRFFYVDRNWLDALVQGALSVGTVNSADREKLTKLYPVVRREVDVAERLVRMKDADAPAVDAAGRPIGVAGPMTGFLMRSQIVSGWPGLHVRAYSTDTRPDDQTIPDMDTSPDRVRLLRMERLAPAVLLVLFDGVPAVVHIEEPRSGIQFGVRVKGAAQGSASAVLPLRNVAKPNDGFLKTGGGKRSHRQRAVPQGCAWRHQPQCTGRDIEERERHGHRARHRSSGVRGRDAPIPDPPGLRGHEREPDRRCVRRDAEDGGDGRTLRPCPDRARLMTRYEEEQR